jgi:hypothetical protein
MYWVKLNSEQNDDPPRRTQQKLNQGAADAIKIKLLADEKNNFFSIIANTGFNGL